MVCLVSVLTRRSGSSEEDRSSVREVILDATVRLLDGGAAFAELSVGSIVQEAGVSRPTFYAYLRDKRDLVLALGERFERHAHLPADDWLEMRSDDLRATLEGVLGAFREQHSTLRAVTEAATYDPEAARFWRAFHERFITNVVERALQAGYLGDDEDLQAEAFALVWMTSRSFAEHLDAPRVSDRALLDALVRLWHPHGAA